MVCMYSIGSFKFIRNCEIKSLYYVKVLLISLFLKLSRFKTRVDKLNKIPACVLRCTPLLAHYYSLSRGVVDIPNYV